MMKRTLSLTVVSILLSNLVYAPIDELSVKEIPTHSSLRELSTARNAYEEHMLKTVDYVQGLHTPGYIRKSVKNVRTYDPETNTHEVIPKYSWSFWEGAAMETGRPMDCYIASQAGRGFFMVQIRPGLIAYTRDGRFRMDHLGRIVTVSNNYPVLAEGGQIMVLKSPDIHISRQGVIYDGEDRVGKLAVTVFKHVSDMKNAFYNFNASFFGLKYPIPVENLEDEEEHYSIIQGRIMQSNTYSSKDSGAYKNYHTASARALKLMVDVTRKQNQYMIAPN